jgi:hypothetical protein
MDFYQTLVSVEASNTEIPNRKELIKLPKIAGLNTAPGR